MNRIHRHAPSVTPQSDSATDAVVLAALSYRDALYLYGGGVLTWAELVTKHRELRAVIRQRRAR